MHASSTLVSKVLRTKVHSSDNGVVQIIIILKISNLGRSLRESSVLNFCNSILNFN